MAAQRFYGGGPQDLYLLPKFDNIAQGFLDFDRNWYIFRPFHINVIHSDMSSVIII